MYGFLLFLFLSESNFSFFLLIKKHRSSQFVIGCFNVFFLFCSKTFWRYFFPNWALFMKTLESDLFMMTDNSVILFNHFITHWTFIIHINNLSLEEIVTVSFSKFGFLKARSFVKDQLLIQKN